jgi:COP9 signalosome complex subunit 5
VIAKDQSLINKKPWADNVNYFKYCRISLVASLKMLNHAKRGGDNEVMGLLIGYISERTFNITDCFPLPAEATETRVNAGLECENYRIEFMDYEEALKKNTNVRGWYHSHPSYGCWLSGIDV